MYRLVLVVVVAAVRPALADEPANRLESLLPLAVGNSWIYRVAGQEDRFVVRVVRKEMIGDQTCFRLEGSLKDRVVASEHLAFQNDGLYRYRVDKEDVVPPVCVLKVPGPKGTRWRQPSYQIGSRSANASFFATTGEVAVPASNKSKSAGVDKFKTVNVDATAVEGAGRPAIRTIVSYAAGVGIVKQEVIEGKRPVVLELEKFAKGDK